MSKKNGKQGMVKKGTLPRIIKTLFEFYPVMMPVVLICIVFSAIVSSIPSVFMQQVISVIDSNYKTGDWEGVSGKIIRLVTILAVFYIFFTAVLNLIPDQKYEKYVQSDDGCNYTRLIKEDA